MKHFFLSVLPAFLIAVSCEGTAAPDPMPELPPMSLKEMAEMISSLPLTVEHVSEVEDAVRESSVNGYDEEYMMTDLISSPGSGVGSNHSGTKAPSYPNPIRNLIKDYLTRNGGTKSGDSGTAVSLDEYLHRISASDMQIYWPFHELWDGKALPVITFDPGNDAISNIGYEIVTGDDGSREVREMIVTESIAKERPVWVINSNNDSAYTTYEMMEHLNAATKSCGTKADGDVRTLLLKEFKMKRHYDSWFRGASEFPSNAEPFRDSPPALRRSSNSSSRLSRIS